MRMFTYCTFIIFRKKSYRLINIISYFFYCLRTYETETYFIKIHAYKDLPKAHRIRYAQSTATVTNSQTVRPRQERSDPTT